MLPRKRVHVPYEKTCCCARVMSPRETRRLTWVEMELHSSYTFLYKGRVERNWKSMRLLNFLSITVQHCHSYSICHKTRRCNYTWILVGSFRTVGLPDMVGMQPFWQISAYSTLLTIRPAKLYENVLPPEFYKTRAFCIRSATSSTPSAKCSYRGQQMLSNSISPLNIDTVLPLFLRKRKRFLRAIKRYMIHTLCAWATIPCRSIRHNEKKDIR
jgi:hypothetical protein